MILVIHRHIPIFISGTLVAKRDGTPFLVLKDEPRIKEDYVPGTFTREFFPNWMRFPVEIGNALQVQYSRCEMRDWDGTAFVGKHFISNNRAAVHNEFPCVSEASSLI